MGHQERGRKLTTVSTMSIGAGSVGVSARPAFPTTWWTSGKLRVIASRRFRSSPTCVMFTLGRVVGMSMTASSPRGGMNRSPSGWKTR